ncbi:DUF4397 domain-containing protein [Algoriphagus mannitolivorans]|uniref:DUF4397 domain-containing protein n=1 Tax=Algoriphagus mannitolivorans TaxID=226504 RepID=UPI000410B5A0|nr:DUF4397 domain-containing protein [Algoriphagus mannitolivorans]
MRLTKSILAGLVLATSAVLTSCLGDLESPALPPTAYVSIYQGSPDAPALDIFANANKVNREPMQFSQVLAYNAFYPGNRDFRFSPYNSATSLLEKGFKLSADSVYSLFVINESANLDAILVKDIWKEPTSTKAQLRLVHLSPDTESVQLKINDNTAPLISNTAYKGISEFLEITPGKSTLTIGLAGTGQTLLTSGSLELKGNRVYTLVLRGLKSQTTGDKKLDIQLITNYISY